MQVKNAIAQREARADVLTAELFAISRAQAARAIAEGRLRIEAEQIAKPSQLLPAGAVVYFSVPDAVEDQAQGEDIPLEIVYQDEDIAVVVKPSGMVVHPAAGNQSGTLVNALLYALDGLSGIGGVKRPGIVHRLDKDTSGLLLVAKNDRAHLHLSAQLKARTMDKRYLAVVEGEMSQPSGQVDAAIARSKRDRKRMAIDPQGRQAVTDWSLLENLRGGALLSVHILTGRTHQIRVHMQSIHHPVAGDPIYGAKRGLKVPRLMLHAHRLSFTHPSTGQVLCLTAPPPAVFVDTIEKWRLPGAGALLFDGGEGG